MSDSQHPEPKKPAEPAVTTLVVPGVVDVVVLSRIAGGAADGDRWQVLTLQRGPNTRCTGAWEIVHGRIERDEKPEHAALREIVEETGLAALRLYSITVQAFYLHQIGTVQLAIVFAAVVDGDVPVTLGSEHSRAEWRTFAGASEILAWPREREALAHVQQLLKNGDAGPVEDVLRVL